MTPSAHGRRRTSAAHEWWWHPPAACSRNGNPAAPAEPGAPSSSANIQGSCATAWMPRTADPTVRDRPQSGNCTCATTPKTGHRNPPAPGRPVHFDGTGKVPKTRLSAPGAAAGGRRRDLVRARAAVQPLGFGQVQVDHLAAGVDAGVSPASHRDTDGPLTSSASASSRTPWTVAARAAGPTR